MNREAAIARRDELQGQYNAANNHARELAGAIAAYDEVIELFDKETADALAPGGELTERSDHGTEDHAG